MVQHPLNQRPTLSLSPLSNDDTARLIGLLLGRPLLEAGEQSELVLRAGGNPLYAEQYTQMLAERGDGAIPEVPESIQGIIGARLDSLAAEEKRIVQDAAVIGKVFWAGAVAALDGGAERSQLEARLHALERKQFVRRERQSSVADETQYAFLHLLLRDVAYGQIPRGGRVDKHLLAARWLESLGRLEDHAEMLAYHYTSALELARAAQQDIAAIAPGARAALRAAGDRARALYAYPSAVELYRSARELWPKEAREERADLLFRLALAKYGTADADRVTALEEAHAALLEVGAEARAAEADSVLAQVWWNAGRRDLVFEHLERGYDLIRDAGPSPEKAQLLSQLARYRMLAGTFDPGQGQEALALAESLGLDEVRANVLITIGTARFQNADPGGREEIERGLEIALAGNWWDAVVRAYSNLADLVTGAVRVDEALGLAREAGRAAQRLGSDERRWGRGNMIALLLAAGEWDECRRAADEFLAESERLGPHYLDGAVFASRARLRLARGEERAALEDQANGLERARLAKDPQILYPALALSAYVLAETGHAEASRALLDELVALGPDVFDYAVSEIGDAMWAARAVGRCEEVRQALAEAKETPWLAAARAVLDEDCAGAARIFDAAGAARSAALARLRAAEALVAKGRRAEADAELGKALAFFRAVGATRYARRGEALLAASA